MGAMCNKCEEPNDLMDADFYCEACYQTLESELELYKLALKNCSSAYEQDNNGYEFFEEYMKEAREELAAKVDKKPSEGKGKGT